MTKRPTTIFVCSKCDAQYPKWMGRCTECGSWSTLNEQVKRVAKKASAGKSGTVETLATFQTENQTRLKCGMNEFDRVLGGGLVPGSVTLLGGDPGIGKSTLVLQVGGLLAAAGKTVLYVSGEESSSQVKIRFERLGLKTHNLKFLGETDVDTIIATIDEHRPVLVLLDSIQTMRCAEVDSEPGSIGQVRAVTGKLVEAAKNGHTPIIIVGHVTKQGNVAGPRTLEHLVDVVLYLEGDDRHLFRVLRGVKNRFGATSEVGVFDMQRGGLREVPNPSAIFLSERQHTNPGSVVTAIVEGSRSFLVEVQALVSRTNFGYPQRRASGFDLNRLQLLIAVLMKKAGLYLSNQDIHLNVAGGWRVNEPAVDAAVCLAIASATRGRPVPADTAVFGEVGLSGEMRAVSQTEKRLEEVKKMGFKYCVMPSTKVQVMPHGLKLIMATTITDAIKDIV
ncbi:MAG: DNA repair protein RadA [Patescibacteria group bacterium]